MTRNQEETNQLELDIQLSRDSKEQGAVECLGLTFESDEARREYFLEKLREKLKEPEFRQIEGFPIGEDEAILALSDPPYYTACPNPFIEDFIKYWNQEKGNNPLATQDVSAEDNYHREPFTSDVSEGKTDSLFTAHSYHTKVPHKAIMRYILHYTEPGDIVLDGFGGSGMTGVAAQMCGKPDPEFKRIVETEWETAGLGLPKWSSRRIVLNDIGVAATFIEANYNLPFDIKTFEREAKQILEELTQEIGWMYETLHTDGKTKGRINYTVWSDVFSCPECSGEVLFLNEALDPKTKKIKDVFPCPHCNANLTKNRMDRLYETYLDSVLGETIKCLKRQPALINYTVGKLKYEKQPDNADLDILHKLEDLPLPIQVPTNTIPFMHMTHQRARISAFGITHIHHFFLPRAAQALGRLWEKASSLQDTRLRNMLLFFVEQAVMGISVLNRYQPIMHGQPGGSQVNRYLSGVYYVGSQIAEVSPWYNLEAKLGRLVKAFKKASALYGNAVISTSTTANLILPSGSIDYIFTDPPFGENIYYADLNFLVESWHKLKTNAQPEAIIDKAKGKKLHDYQQLMQHCFEQYYRVLKPGRWMTVVFHNSLNAVWNAIQEAMLSAGFVVADVRTLDKQQGSYRQVTSTAVKQDLIISAYKPNTNLEERFQLEAGTEEGCWEFVRTHLQQLPVFVSKNGQAEAIAERQNYLLFDRMVAFHVQRGVTLPLSAAEFYGGLVQRFSERDGMYFLAEQVAEYDRKRMTVREVLQLELFVTDESSAVQWLKQQLTKKPQTFQELHPQFMREIAGWSKFEKPLELSELLEQNFLCYDGKGVIPNQIVSWLKQSAIHREKIRQIESESPTDTAGLETRDAGLLSAAKDKWYIPDPSKANDLEKLRDRSLLREFEEYRQSKLKTLKVFRLEAVRTGFKKAWQERDYPTIIEVARKVPNTVLQEDPKLLMWYDQALTRVGEEE